ncbi:hypothetical protein N7451_007699 [Penicillium sp. IBT 35674x]|nr:hypothetical protein N7451_007699 [Penicillium sp. IBT 35674x]
MVVSNPSFKWDIWAKSGLLLHSLGLILAVSRPRKTMSSSTKKDGLGKKPETHPGSRNVSSMSAEKLERKRAHDREAQRSIRQRTKENIEQLKNEVASLQSRVAEMQPRYNGYEELLQHNMVLEEEVRGLKRQLAVFTERRSVPVLSRRFSTFPDNCSIQEGPDTRGNSAPSVPSTDTMHSQFHDVPNTPGLPLVPGTNQVYSLHASDWTPYTNTRSRSLGCSDQEPSARMEPYVIDGQLHEGPRLTQPSLSVVVPQISFGGPDSAPTPQLSGSPYPQVPYPRSMSMSIPSSAQAASVQPTQLYQSSPPFHDSLNQTSTGNQTYTYHPWVSKS